MFKRITSLVLGMLLVASLIPTTALGAGGSGTDADVDVGASQAGTFWWDQTGYRMYIIDPDGGGDNTPKRVSNILDIVLHPSEGLFDDNRKMLHDFVFATNPRFEALSTRNYDSGSKLVSVTPDYAIVTWWDIKNTIAPTFGLTLSELKPPLTDYSGGTWKLGGDDFKLWMLNGKGMPGASYTPSTGGIKITNYNGGSSSSSSSDYNTSTSTTYKEIVNQQLAVGKNTIDSYHQAVLAGAKYSKQFAMNEAMTKVLNALNATGDSMLVANAGLAIHSELVKYIGKLDGDWDTSKGTLSLPQDYIASLFEIGYAAYNDEDNGNFETLTKLQLLQITDESIAKVYNDSGEVNLLPTISQNQLYLIVEPTFWVKPAKVNLVNVYSKWFYGTAVNYGQWYQSLTADNSEWKKNGGDGGGGNKSHYGNIINKAIVGSMILDMPLTVLPGDGEETPYKSGVIINAFDENGRDLKDEPYLNSELASARLKDGFGMHYYYVEGASPQLPSVPTYDKTKTDTPHPVQDCDTPENGGTIPRVMGSDDTTSDDELEKPGTPHMSAVLDGSEGDFEQGYKNTTRTITIVKTYSQEVMCAPNDPKITGINDSGLPVKLEHITTQVQVNCPGTIFIQHEPDYKVVDWKVASNSINDIFSARTPTASSIKNKGADPDGLIEGALFVSDSSVGDHISDISWDSIKSFSSDNPEVFLPTIDVIDSESYTWEQVGDEKAGTTVHTVRLGLAADRNLDGEIDEGENEDDYNAQTLYVHLIKGVGTPQTHTLDDPTPSNGNSGDEKSPGAAPDPLAPYENPDMPEEEKKQLVHNIVKVYETKTIDVDGTETLSLDGIYTRTNTAGIITIEEEGHLTGK